MRRVVVTLISTLVLLIAISTFSNPPGSKAQDQGRRCGLQTLKGNYGNIFNGTIVPPAGSPFPFSGVGVVTFDGNGNVTATEQASSNGFPLQITFDGTYVVNADCTGTITAIFNPGNFEGHISIVIVGNGNEAFGVATDLGSVVTNTLKRQ
ncbi:MAG TPA: hypothetical protein VKN18_14455 [Blastocatellia bacterium]|nr:hypothetical protein [Blastocatellia bacterium]